MKKNKKNKRKKISIFLVVLIVILVYFLINVKIITNEGKIITIGEIIKTNINNAKNTILEKDDFEVILNIQTPYITSNQKYIANLKVNDISDVEDYKVMWGIGEDLDTITLSEELELSFDLSIEGKNTCIIKVLEGDNVIYDWEKDIYYIKPYEKQFLDEFELHGVSDYFMWMDIDKENELFEYLGEKIIRSDIRETTIEESGYTLFDRTIPKMIENNYKVIGILGSFSSDFFKKDGKVTCQEDLDKFLEYAEGIITRYPDIYAYEIINEPNIVYTTEEDIQWYVKMVRGVKDIINKNNSKSLVIAGATVNPTTEEDTRMPSIEFLSKITEIGAYNVADVYSFHLYDFSTVNELNKIFEKSNKEHKEFMNNIGGFQKLYLTEMGIEAKDDDTEEKQAMKIIQQEIIAKEYNIALPIVFSFRDTGGRSWGINTGSYEPKKAFYALKNYYENTNGAEYIGKINVQDGLDFYVFNKDGKPKIIAWSNHSGKTIELDYIDFTARDIYGNKIENIDGKLQITTSPVYLDDISSNYYYQAISNTTLEKFSEFEQKFSNEISKIDGISESIDELKQYMLNIKNKTNEDENVAKQQMEKFFKLGNKLIEEYKKGTLDVEYVKLSSMLDMLNDIGNSYEDLVTVTCKTRNPDLSGTKNLIDEVDKTIENNNDIEIIYPSKILEFTNELYEKSKYINNLEEENDIKTGLIVSKDLHAKYLVQWAKEFVELYIDEYINSNPVTVTYSVTEMTNKEVTATLNIGPDSHVTNNNNKNTYTFQENGEYIFEYERRGRNFQAKATVNNIDKAPPKITGAEDGQVYNQSVKLKITDQNLEKIELYLNGTLQENYTQTQNITQEGFYQVKATDKAGNVTTVNFDIIYREEDEYDVTTDKICNITVNTTAEKIADKLPIKQEYTILRNEKELQKGEKVATGDILKLTSGREYTLIVKGDLNSDGTVNIVDLVRTQNAILKRRELTNIEELAADANYDKEQITIKDLVRIQIIILNPPKM